MTAFDDTQPKRSDVFPPELQDDNTSSSPGCLAWGIAGGFSLMMAAAVVLLAAFAGWNDGLRVARANATATRSQDIAVQCLMIPTDIAANRLNTVANRFADLQKDGTLPDCALPQVALATEAYQANLATPTSSPTLTQTAAPPSPTPTQITTATASADTDEATPTRATNSRFDTTALLQQARSQLDAGNYEEAIRTLDAIKAIDPTFQPDTVDNLLFGALTTRARNLYLTRSEANLGQAISLTNRAENYGDLSNNDISFERLVGELYLDAQSYTNINYPEAIRLLERVRGYSPNYLGTNSQLVDQYKKYAELLAGGAEYCRAAQQYDAALVITPNNPSLMQARQTAQQQCISAPTPVSGTPATPDPNATPATASPETAATPTPTFAPVGQQ